MKPAIFGLSGATLTADERAFFRDADPVGYVLFARNVADRAQLRALTDELRALHGREDLLVSIDQEGGRVARMKPPEWARYPAGEAFAALYERAPISAIEAARVNAELLGRDLAEVGISLDFWPLLDLPQPGAHDVIGDRALGTEPMQVAALGRAILEGLARVGVAGCIKHMPGHGRAQADSHAELPVVTASEAELEADLAPFRALCEAPAGMTAHIRYTAWDTEHAATLSRFVIGEIIRKRIGFDGLLLSDDIDMQALAGSVPERSAAAIAAGCDLVLNCWARMDDMVAIAGLLPDMGEQTARRLDKALACTGAGDGASAPPSGQEIERAELLAKRDALLALVHGRRLMEEAGLFGPAESGIGDTAEVWDAPLAPASGDDERLYLQLDGWEGPLDLLLDLARRQKVDLRQISILALVDQYLEHIEEAGALRLELAADYLVMAAWLAYLKSALLLPREEQPDPDPEELALRLQLRLQRLAAMREAAARLMGRDRLGRDVFARGAPEGLRMLKRNDWRCDWYALVHAYGQVRLRTEPVVHMVRERPVVTLESALERVAALLGVTLDWLELRTFLPRGAEPRLARSALASSFVAALELARRGRAELRQEETFGPLHLRRLAG